ncbi:hypothetical protein Pmani_029149 [Petrolisthes manimaculis]|uniref:Uncharacterized protein n=1 Tax=Petrolisthes manimaculis TaxID=1843537 RepID=A0AAE1P0M2_9EUCA|nr:hypothetical protein Pmani_029149 [Petrolisthes manimaculis]
MYCSVEVLVLTLVPRSYRRKDIKANIVLVTGGGSGIGRLMCLKMAARGALIVTWDVSQKGNDETVRQVLASGGKCWSYTVDITDRQAVYTTAVKVKQQVGKVDILINNAGVVTGKKLLDCPDEAILKTFQVNSISHFWTTKAFLPDMMASNTGHIVTIASMAGKCGASSLIDYCASKHSAVGFDESLRLELHAEGKDGIKTTLVCSMQFSTGMFEGAGSKYLPLLTPEYVAEETVDGILMNYSAVYIPRYIHFVSILNMLLPEKANHIMADLLGVSSLMDNFVGHRKAN